MLAAGFNHWLPVVAPVLFVLFWSGGFTAGAVGLESAEPLTLLLIRFILAAMILTGLAVVSRARLPQDPWQMVHIAIAGLLTQAFYFCLVYTALTFGAAAGAIALIMGFQPAMTALFAYPMLNERLAHIQILGMFIGFAGTIFVLNDRLTQGMGTITGAGLTILALFSISFGTLYQKKYCKSYNLLAGGALQSWTAVVVLLLPALLTEDNNILYSPGFFGAMAYLVVVNSILAVALLSWMIERGEASKVASLFFLVPPLAALIAFVVLGEKMGMLAQLGMLIAVIGVALVMKKPRQTV